MRHRKTTLIGLGEGAPRHRRHRVAGSDGDLGESIGGDIEIGKHGWIALGLGTFFSLLIGCGLMALMFFSSRRGYDEAADPFRLKKLLETNNRNL